MSGDRLEVNVTFDERGYIGSAPELRQAVPSRTIVCSRRKRTCGPQGGSPGLEPEPVIGALLEVVPTKASGEASSGAHQSLKPGSSAVLTGLNPLWPDLNLAVADFKPLCPNFPLS
jgi:hypothetical protein